MPARVTEQVGVVVLAAAAVWGFDRPADDELVAAIKIRTSNKKGRHISTAEAIRLLEDYGLETPDGFDGYATNLDTLRTLARK